MESIEGERKEQQQAFERAVEQARKEWQLADEARKKEIDKLEAQMKADNERMQSEIRKRQQEYEELAEQAKRDQQAAIDRAEAAEAAAAQGDGLVDVVGNLF